jgi:hypothetical protein
MVPFEGMLIGHRGFLSVGKYCIESILYQITGISCYRTDGWIDYTRLDPLNISRLNHTA